jgi:hypothetical protein
MRDNHTLWHAQVLAVLHGAQLAGFLHGTNKALEEKNHMAKKSSKDEDEAEQVSNPTF